MRSEWVDRSSRSTPVPGWLALFVDVHLRPLWRTWLPAPTTVLAVVGVALGTAVMVGALILYVAIGRPFTSFGDVAARTMEYQVTPRVLGRLPESTFRTIRDTPGVTEAVPFVGGLSMVSAGAGGDTHGVFVAGSDCHIEAVVGPFECETRADELAEGPGVPLVVSQALATALDVGVGDSVGLSGGSVGDAHVAAIADDVEGNFDDVNAGFWVFGEVTGIQDLLSTGPFLSAALVNSDDPAAIDELRASLVAEATVDRPGMGLGSLLTMTRTLMSVAGILVFVGGILIATSSLALALDHRRKDFAIVNVLGNSRRRMRRMLAAEGMIVGLAGGAVAIPFAYLCGRLLTNIWGRALLSGTGARLVVPWDWWIFVACLVGGVCCGLAAALPAAARVVRQADIDVIAGETEEIPTHRAPRWPILLVLLIPAGLWLGHLWGLGNVSDFVGYGAYLAVAVGVLGFGFGVTPLILAVVERIYGSRGQEGWLAAAELGRDPLRVAAIVTVAALAVFLAMGLRTLRILAVESVTEDVESELDGRLLVSPRAPGDQIDARLTDAAVRKIRNVPGVGNVLSQYLAVVDTDDFAVNIAGTDPTDPRQNLDILDSDAATAWGRVADGELILGRLFANSYGHRAGGTITLVALNDRGQYERTEFRIAAIAVPRFGVDNGIGNLIVASTDTIQQRWAAGSAAVIVVPDAETPADVLADRLESQSHVVGLSAVAHREAREVAEAGAGRFLGPVEWMGRVMIVVAGLGILNFLLLALLTRKRTRAALRFIGYSPNMERRTLLYEAAAMAAVGAVLGGAGSLLSSWFQVLTSPALLASQVEFRFVLEPLVTVGLLVVLMVVLGLIPAWAMSGRLNILKYLAAD